MKQHPTLAVEQPQQKARHARPGGADVLSAVREPVLGRVEGVRPPSCCAIAAPGTVVASIRLPLRLALVPLLFLCLPPVWTQTTADPIPPIISALRARDFTQALQLLEPALEKFPRDPRLWSLEGVALSGQGHKKEALAAFQHALSLAPNYLQALEGAAQIEYDAGSAAAIPLLDHVLELRPDDQTSHAMLAVLEYQRGRCAAAVPHFEKAGSLLDSQVDALHAYSTCLMRLKRFDDAATVFARAVALQPDDPRERHLLASIQLMAHKPQDALATLAPLLEVQNPDADTLELAASAYEDARDTPKAVATLRQAIIQDPRNVNLYLDFANVAFNHQSFQVGIDVITDGLGVMPTASPLYLARGVLYVQLADYDKAEADFEKAYELDPSQSLSSAAQGLAAVQEHDFDRALATVQSKLARKPNDPLLLYLQADVLVEKGADPGTPEFDLAMRSAKKAVLLQPSLADAHDVLAKLYLMSGQNQAAAEQCRKAISINPKDQTAVYHLIQALRKTGEKAQIPELLKRLAELRAESTQDEREHNRYKLVEETSETKGSLQP
jgi:tetratricopeptide (TPR) repeat protein